MIAVVCFALVGYLVVVVRFWLWIVILVVEFVSWAGLVVLFVLCLVLGVWLFIVDCLVAAVGLIACWLCGGGVLAYVDVVGYCWLMLAVGLGC